PSGCGGRARWPTGRLYSPAVPQAGTLRNGTCERVRIGWPRGCPCAVLSTEVVLEQYLPRNCAHGSEECCPQSLPAEAIVAVRRWPSERAVAGTLRLMRSEERRVGKEWRPRGGRGPYVRSRRAKHGRHDSDRADRQRAST